MLGLGFGSLPVHPAMQSICEAIHLSNASSFELRPFADTTNAKVRTEKVKALATLPNGGKTRL